MTSDRPASEATTETHAREPDAPQLPSAERLVNLTPHEVVLQATVPPGEGDDLDRAEPATVRLVAQGRFARVDDDASRLSQGWLNAGTSLIAVTRLRRSGKLTDLPRPEPGTRLVVSRVTALAARHRRDLVFPLGEVRDPAGQITGVRGLAAFRPGWAPAQWYRDRRTAARAGLAARPLGKEWLTGVLFAAATALLSGFLALIPGAADNALRHGWAGGGLAWTSWSSIGCLVAGGALLVAGARQWRRRTQILTERGTAYVIDEVAIPWQHEEKESVLADIKAGFARTLLVPGPGALGDAWQWQGDAESAACWDEKADALVRSFWAVHYNDDQVTRNALFTWAPWPVAMAFGARATARRRGLVLNVRQRPSYGAAGSRQELRITDPAHDFLRAAPPEPLEHSAPEHSVTCLRGHLTLSIESPATRHADQLPDSPSPGPVTPHGRSASPRLPLLLLVRTTHDAIGPVPLNLAEVPPVTVHVPERLAASVLPAGTHTVPVVEWRLDCASTPVPQLPWKAFPAAAEEIAGWVVAQAAAHPDHVVLLATRIPQELSVGLGIQLGQRRHEWPHRAYPVFYERGRLIVPDLMLGAESVTMERS
jgi:hypothetical protein